MQVIDLAEYRQRLAKEEQIALNVSDEELELYAIDGDLEDEIDWVETARAGLYPPLHCVKGRGK